MMCVFVEKYFLSIIHEPVIGGDDLSALWYC